jgi:hypothetical protein
MNTKKRPVGTLRDNTSISSQDRSKFRKVTAVTTTTPSYEDVRPLWTDTSGAKTFSSYLPQLKANNKAERFAFQYCDMPDIKIRSVKKKDKLNRKFKEKKEHEVRDDEEEEDKVNNSNNNSNNNNNNKNKTENKKMRRKKSKNNKKRKKKKLPQDPTSGLWFLRNGYLHSDRSKDDME